MGGVGWNACLAREAFDFAPGPRNLSACKQLHAAKKNSSITFNKIVRTAGRAGNTGLFERLMLKKRCLKVNRISKLSVLRGHQMADVGKAVTRTQLYDAVYRKVGRSRTDSSAFVELVLEEIKSSIERGETVKLSSFGTFTVRKKAQRMGRNPKTGVDVPISPRRVVVFKASAIMKQQINGDRIKLAAAQHAQAEFLRKERELADVKRTRSDGRTARASVRLRRPEAGD
jgi:integration host factor subunit alpha